MWIGGVQFNSPCKALSRLERTDAVPIVQATWAENKAPAIALAISRYPRYPINNRGMYPFPFPVTDNNNYMREPVTPAVPPETSF